MAHIWHMASPDDLAREHSPGAGRGRRSLEFNNRARVPNPAMKMEVLKHAPCILTPRVSMDQEISWKRNRTWRQVDTRGQPGGLPPRWAATDAEAPDGPQCSVRHYIKDAEKSAESGGGPRRVQTHPCPLISWMTVGETFHLFSFNDDQLHKATVLPTVLPPGRVDSKVRERKSMSITRYHKWWLLLLGT